MQNSMNKNIGYAVQMFRSGSDLDEWLEAVALVSDEWLADLEREWHSRNLSREELREIKTADMRHSRPHGYGGFRHDGLPLKNANGRWEPKEDGE